MQYIGVDLHKDNFVACFLNGDDDSRITLYPHNDEGLLAFKAAIQFTDHVAVEALGYARHFTRVIKPLVNRFVLVSPYHFRVISASVKKTDKHDAIALAKALRDNSLPEAHVRSEVAQQIRNLLHLDEKIVKHRVAMKFLTDQVLFQAGHFLGSVPRYSEPFYDKQGDLQLNIGDDYILKTMFDVQKTENKVRWQISKKLYELTDSLGGREVLMSIPGIGILTASAILSNIDGIERFTSSKQLCAYFGLVPKVRSSNKKKGYGRITKRGHKKTRSALVHVSSKISKKNESLDAFYQKIRQRTGNHRAAKVAVARKLLTLIFFMLKSQHVLGDEEFEAINFQNASLLGYL